MLTGDPFKRNFTSGLGAQVVSFACLGTDKPETNGFPNYNRPGGLRAQIFFPAAGTARTLTQLIINPTCLTRPARTTTTVLARLTFQRI